MYLTPVIALHAHQASKDTLPTPPESRFTDEFKFDVRPNISGNSVLASDSAFAQLR
jgi:hypothetical protein